MNTTERNKRITELEAVLENAANEIAALKEPPANRMEPWVMGRPRCHTSVSIKASTYLPNGITLLVGGSSAALSHEQAAELAMQLLNGIRQQRGVEFKGDLYAPSSVLCPLNGYVQLGLHTTSRLLATLRGEGG